MIKQVTQHKRTNPKLFAYGAILIIALIILVPIVFFSFERSTQNATVATVNGEPITYAEFKQFLNEQRASVFSYFNKKYGAVDSDNFWKSSYGGEVPLDIARKKTLEKLKRIKIEQSLMKKYGLINDISYNSFLEKLKKENKGRKEDVAKGKVIYGPVQYGISDYFMYIHSNNIIQLKEKMQGKEIVTTEEQIKGYYDSNIEEYKKESNIKVDMLSVLWTDRNGNVDKLKKDKARLAIEEIKKIIERGESFEKAVDGYKNQDGITVKYEEQVFEGDSLRREFEMFPVTIALVKELEVGKLSEIVEEGGGFVIIKPVEKKDGGYTSFDEVKDLVKSKIVDKKYEELVNKLMDEAEININQKVFMNIPIK